MLFCSNCGQQHYGPPPLCSKCAPIKLHRITEDEKGNLARIFIFIPIVYLILLQWYWLKHGYYPNWSLCGFLSDDHFFSEKCDIGTSFIGLNKILNYVGDNPLIFLLVIAAICFLYLGF